MHEPDPSLPWANNVILRVEVGSTAHGTGLDGHEDYDELGVWIPTFDHWAGVPVRSQRADTIVYRPGRRTGERSQPGDYDLTVHSARKTAALLADGNPSMLMLLFGPVRFHRPIGLMLREIGDAFWSQSARDKFLGYARAQRQRLTGERGGRHVNRTPNPGGYDGKYAMHMLRLGIQGIEYMKTGQITLPMPIDARHLLLWVRRGEIPLERVIELAESAEKRLAEATSSAPDHPDFYRINRWLYQVMEIVPGAPIRDVDA